MLLLPTGHYMAAGIAAVAATLVLLAFPAIGAAAARLAEPVMFGPWRPGRLARWTSAGSFLLLAFVLHAGLIGPTDPLANPVGPLIWVFWWIVLLLVQALVGDVWHWIDPWRAPVTLARRAGLRPVITLPARLGAAPALAALVLFCLFMIADPAPYDPRRLASVVAGYWMISFAGMILFGRRAWAQRCEFVGIAMRRFAAMAPLGVHHGRLCAGLPGWQIVQPGGASLSLGLFVLAMLGAGTFESLHTTFVWLKLTGVNPLEYPGRSALMVPTAFGLVATIVLVTGLFAAAVAAGQYLAGDRRRWIAAFRHQAQCTLPIIAAYHFAHYLTALLVDGQYLLAAIGDPYGTGADLLGLGHVHVTTGFLQTRAGAQAVWLTQAGAIVAGHVLAILLSHRVALDMHGCHGRALRAQLPVSAFMVFYTFMGLWLLASPTAI